MAKTQFEALIEHIINDEEEAARELLHDIVVQTSRQIYNEMAAEEEESEESEEKVDEASFDEAGGDMSDDMIDDVEADEEGMSMDDAGDELGDEMGMGDEDGEHGDEMGGEGDELEDRVVDLEAALDELKAEFDQLMSQEEGEPEHADMDMGGDDMGADMGDMGDDMPAEEGVVREYVEKVKDFYKGDNSEGKTIGTGGSDKPGVNKKSIVDNMKNDMGGTVKNLVQGGANNAPDGNSPPKAPSNAYKTNNAQEIDVAKRNVNQVGGNKGASDFYGTKAKAKTGEESGTNDKSIIKKL